MGVDRMAEVVVQEEEAEEEQVEEEEDVAEVVAKPNRKLK